MGSRHCGNDWFLTNAVTNPRLPAASKPDPQSLRTHAPATGLSVVCSRVGDIRFGRSFAVRTAPVPVRSATVAVRANNFCVAPRGVCVALIQSVTFSRCAPSSTVSLYFHFLTPVTFLKYAIPESEFDLHLRPSNATPVHGSRGYKL